MSGPLLLKKFSCGIRLDQPFLGITIGGAEDEESTWSCSRDTRQILRMSAVKRFFHFLYWVLKIGLPLNLAVFPAIAIYGHFSTWIPAEEVLSGYVHQVPVMVGGSVESETVWNGNEKKTTSHVERSYVLIPSVFHDPKIITIRQTNQELYEVDELAYGFLYLLLWYVFCVFGTWWVWFRRMVNRV